MLRPGAHTDVRADICPYYTTSAAPGATDYLNKMVISMKKIRFFAVLSLLIAVLTLLTPLAFADEETTEPTKPIEELPWVQDPAVWREDMLADAPEYEANCGTALLLELNSGTVVYAKNAEETVYPASLTKIMTCMLALQYAGNRLDAMVTVSSTALEGIAEAGGEVKLKEGEQMTLRDLLYYLMVVSSNEAANVVAEYVAGSVPSFVNSMNRTAEELGCTGTHFANAHGLHDPNHYTTARDLSIITRKALANETFREIVSTPTYVVPATNLSPKQTLTTTNFLILENGKNYLADNGSYYTYYYDLATGVKTGYTSAAGRCVISRATDGHMDLLVVILGADTPLMSDGSTRFNNFVEAKKLFHYGFDNFEYAQVVGGGAKPMYSVPVRFSQDKNGVVLVPSGNVNCLLPKDYDKQSISFDYVLDDANGLSAPLQAHQKVGVVRVFYNGTKIGETDLETVMSVDTDTAEKTINKIVTNSVLRKILTYWWILPLTIAGLILLLILRNVLYRAVRKANLRRRREAREQRQRGDQP